MTRHTTNTKNSKRSSSINTNLHTRNISTSKAMKCSLIPSKPSLRGVFQQIAQKNVGKDNEFGPS